MSSFRSWPVASSTAGRDLALEKDLKIWQGWMQKNWPIWTIIIHNQLDWLLYNFIYHICVHPRIHSTQTRTLYYMSLAESIQTTYGIGSQISGTHSIYFGVGRCFVWFWMVLTCAEPPSEFAVSDSKSGRSRDVKRPRRIATGHPFSGHFGVQLAACSMLRGKDQNSNWNSSYTHPISLLYCVNTRHGNET